jgi:hypothetical protein
MSKDQGEEVGGKALKTLYASFVRNAFGRSATSKWNKPDLFLV